MSIAPGHLVPTLAASGPKGAPFSRSGPPGETPRNPDAGPLRVTAVERVRLQPGDRLIIHCDPAMGIGPGGAHKLARELHEGLKLGDLPFEVPIVVTAPGMRLEVLHL